MPDEFTPTRVVKVAKPGQVTGYGKSIRTDRIDPDYIEAAKLAHDNPGTPVVVHEWTIPDDEAKAKGQYRYITEETRAQLLLLNQFDQAGTLPELLDRVELEPPKVDGIERFQVSLTRRTEEKAVRTFVVYHVEGRKIRAVRPKDEEAE